jgi:hypothetical protein
MDDVVKETRDNLCKVGEFDLADQIDNIPPAERIEMLEYTRYLVAIHGSGEILHKKTHSEIISHLWARVVPYDDGSYLRLRILVRVEQLVRECSDIADIEAELMILAAAHGASFGHVFDLHRLSQLVTLGDFDELRRILPSTDVDTQSYVQVMGKAHHHLKMRGTVGIDHAEVLRGVEL